MNDKSIIRTVKQNNYSTIKNSIFTDERLSWKAKGIMGYLMTRPDNWKVIIADLINRSKDGRDAVYSGLKELKQHGYLVHQPIRSETGKKSIIGWEYIAYEEPIETGKDPLTENPEVDKSGANYLLPENPDMDNPEVDNPETDNPTLVINDFSNYGFKDDDNNNVRDDQNLTSQIQPKYSIGNDDWDNPFDEAVAPQPSSSPRSLDTFSPGDSSVDAITALVGLTSPPSPDGQPPTVPNLNLSMDELNEIYESVEGYMTGNMPANSPRQYRLRKGEYSSVNALIASGVTVEFIGKVINDLYAEGWNPNCFAYCVKPIKQRWAEELEKQAPPEPIDWHEFKPQQQSGGSQSGYRTRKVRAGSSKRGMPDPVVPAAQPGKYERFYQVYERQGIDISSVT